MAMITLKRTATCRDCGATLPAGSRARYYGPGKIYGVGCHEDTRTGTAYERGDRSRGAQRSHYDRQGVYTADGTRIGAVSCGHIDYPCCGC